MSLKLLKVINEKIIKFYTPGLQINLAIEDTGAQWIYRKEPDLRYEIELYSSRLVDLIDIMELNFLKGIRESTLMDESEYFMLSDKFSKVIFNYIIMSNQFPEKIGQFDKGLHDIGWTGEIPMRQREYYIGRYKTLKPGLSDEDYYRMMADYFGGALARYKLNGKAAPKGNNEELSSKDYIKILFVPPVPGAPEAITSTNVYYRPITKNYTEYCMPPWRSKGYLVVGPNDSIKPKISNWRSDLQLINNTIKLSGNNKSVEIQADYMCAGE